MPVYLPLIDKAEPCRLLPETFPARRVGGLVIRFLVLLFCFGTGLLALQPHASAETRSLKIYHVHTGEKAVITYKRNGHYIKAGLNKLDYILRDWRKNKQIDMDPRMLDLLWEVYQKSGSHDYIHIICGYRTGDTNAMLRGRSRASGVAKKSQHILGKAIDFYIPDVPLERLREIGMKFQVGGVGYYPTSGSPFVHMDTGWVRAWPRMSRQQLVKLFPNGHTLHLPPDGKPLPGYQEALADYKRRVDGNSIMVAGGGSSGGGGGNLLAALFGGGDEDEELGADDTVQTDPALHRIERKAMAPRAVAERSKAMPPVALPKPSDAPLPGVRPVAIASAEPQQAAPAPTPPAEVQTADAGDAADQKYPDLLAYAIPVPQLLPDRSGSGSAQEATAALIADAKADMSDESKPDAEPDTETILAMVPVPEIRPELTAYAPTEEPQPAFAGSLEPKAAARAAPASVTPKLRPSDIAKAVRKNMDVDNEVVLASLDALPAMNLRPAAKPANTAGPKPFGKVSGASVRGGRVGGKALTRAVIADWAQAKREAGTLTSPFVKGTAAPRMNRLPVRAVAEEETGETHIDPQRFAAVSVYFPND